MKKFFENYDENDVFLICWLVLAALVFYIGYGAGFNAKGEQDGCCDVYYQGYNQGIVDSVSESDPLTITEFKVVSLDVLTASSNKDNGKNTNLFQISLSPIDINDQILNVDILRINDPALDADLKIGSIMYCINGTEYVTASDKRIGMSSLPEPMPDIYDGYVGSDRLEPIGQEAVPNW
ncbi:hypothetical protein CVV43_00690 [Candidatus Saccharibacteria bacterium HGW-Saccharibacteria-1]|jgi:hypothetical protein|nr:MAG: hypothetical protein CVV43_00690 [Candidatus Saccharibacteria bacterium HGW-Saccharibacteria-1]